MAEDRIYYIEEEDLRKWNRSAPPPPGRSRTVRFDDLPEPPADRETILWPVCLGLNTAWFVRWLIWSMPHHLELDLAMPQPAGVALGAVLAFVSIVATMIALIDIWRD